MSQGEGFGLARLAMLFGVVAGVAIGTKIVLDARTKREADKLPAPQQDAVETRPSATILQFKPRR